MAQPVSYSLWKEWESDTYLPLFDIFALLFDTYATLYSKSYIEKTESEIRFYNSKNKRVQFLNLKLVIKIFWPLFYEVLLHGT